MNRAKKSRRRQSRGAYSVEMAVALPVLFTLFFGAYDISRMNALRHSVEIAAYEGARRAIVPGATQSDVAQVVTSMMGTMAAKDVQVIVTPATITDETETVTVTVKLPMEKNGMVAPLLDKNKALSTSVSLRREQY